MATYSPETRHSIRKLRKQGYTFSEIQIKLGMNIPKGTLSYICKDIKLGDKQKTRIDTIIRLNAAQAQKKAVSVNKKIFQTKLENYRKANLDLKEFMDNPKAKLVALAMLYLGEGAKWRGRRSPHLGSSDPLIIRLYIDLLRESYGIPTAALKCRVQHRADQDSVKLMKFWSKITGVPIKNFYPPYADKRTIGKVTRKTNYKGVCAVSCSGTHIQLELEQIAVIISDALRGYGAVG